MKKKYRIVQNTILIAVIFLSVAAKAQHPEKRLGSTRKIADKIVNETRFEYQMVPLTYNGGMIQFTLEGSSEAGADEVFYSHAKLLSESDATGFLGISFSGHIMVYLNGKGIFSGSSGRVELQEYTYNRYLFQQKVPVDWIKGENHILVKCELSSGPAHVLVLPVDHMDQKAPSVNALPVLEETPYTSWRTCGPWHTKAGSAMSIAFPPELGYEDFYKSGEEIIGWKLEEVPLVRELVIPENSSFQRDSYADWNYANGGTMLGILSLYQVTGDERYLDFVKQFAGNIMDNDAYFSWQYFNLHAMRGSFHRIYRKTMLDDTGGPAIPLAQLQLMDPENPRYLPLLSNVLDYVISGQERLADRTFSRPEPEPATLWADDLFMVSPFLLRMAGITGDQKLYDEVARQAIQFNKYLADPETGLYFHGWYHSRQENTPVRWGRANGWIIWATGEILLHMPEDHPEYKTVLKIFRSHMKALAEYQDESGMWHQVLDHPETYEETSCTAMFTLGMARGVRMGWLKESYKERALRGWNALQEKIGDQGTVIDICRGTPIGEDVGFYVSRTRFDHDPRGLGAMLTAGCEIYLLEKEEQK